MRWPLLLDIIEQGLAKDRQADAQQPPDNFLPLAKLSRFERLQLKQAFKLIQAQQAVLAKRYPISR